MKKKVAIILSALLIIIMMVQSSPFEKFRMDKAKGIVEKMTLEEKLSQMIILDIPYVFENGKEEDFIKVNSAVSEFFKTRKPGGIILFENNMKTPEQTKEMISGIQGAKDKLPFFISVDEEGGRISKIPVKLNIPTAKAIGETGDSKNAYNAAVTIGKTLKELGFNLDYAPDMDVNTNPNNPIIGDRAFSSDPKVVGEFGTQYIKGLRKEEILSTAKHFPGHGDTVGDSHKGFVEVPHNIERINSVELVPFEYAIKTGVDFIMVGHISVPALDDTKTPASLSKPIVTDLLKDKMGFKGVIITDALDMKAITDNYDKFDSVKMAINSGNDIALMPDINVIPGKDVSEYDNLIKYLVDEVKSGNIKEARIDEAVTKIVMAKNKIK
ncbi:MAG: glycoside hydrolase family 3 N-terminal domain-containing protein [Clostridium sp.]